VAGDTEPPPLLEREDEKTVLRALLDGAAAGSGSTAVLEGPAGIGKSRLLEVVEQLARDAGFLVLSARGAELERQFSFGMVRQLFEPPLAAVTAAQRAELLAGAATAASGLLVAADGPPAPDMAAPGDASMASMHALFWLTVNLSARAPVLVCGDDLHWSDADSLRFLAYLVPRLRGLPVLLVGATRRGEPGADQHLLDLLVTDPLSTVLQPAALSEAAAAQLVRATVTGAGDRFCAACNEATGGNPLLLRELAVVAAAERITSDAAGLTKLAQIGPRATARRVTMRLARMGPDAVALVGAVAVLGDGAELGHAAELAGLKAARALQVTDELAAVDILRPSLPLEFVHSLVRVAVYESLTGAQRVQGHATAARLLAADAAPAERVASHLLLVPPARDEAVVATLHRAADEATARGSPEAALTYLERCLREPPTGGARRDILLAAGVVAQPVDVTKAAGYLGEALALVTEPLARAEIAEMLGRMLFFQGRTTEAVDVLSRAADELERDHEGLRLRLEAGMVNVFISDPALHARSAGRFAQLRSRSVDPSLGGRMLDCLIAWHDAMLTAPATGCAERALRGLEQNLLTDHPTGGVALADGCWVLAAADRDEVLPTLAACQARAYRRGSVLAAGIAAFYQALTWAWRGSLEEAEAGCREVARLVTTLGVEIGRPLLAALLAETLLEQGRVQDAADALDRLGPVDDLPATAHVYWLIESQARLALACGRPEQALQLFLDVGRHLAVHGWTNPAFLGWRSGAAMACHALGRTEQAQALATEELALARQWGAPRALGRALTVSGLITGGNNGLQLLTEATSVLAPSPARLEHARALIELGAALRRSGQRVESRGPLRQGVNLAQNCGATPLVSRGQTELRAGGARPRRLTLGGPDSLTPSERRVAGLAAAGQSNRDIAQALFVTPKTVEVHLTSTYQKLAVTGRHELASALGATNG
jgi:DNA-binding CsgD family transcriptional regulator